MCHWWKRFFHRIYFISNNSMSVSMMPVLQTQFTVFLYLFSERGRMAPTVGGLEFQLKYLL
jgi:hypothetical protein